MKPSELFWARFEGFNRGEVQEMLADLIMQMVGHREAAGNGIVIDALECSLNKFYEGKEEELQNFLDEI